MSDKMPVPMWVKVVGFSSLLVDIIIAANYGFLPWWFNPLPFGTFLVLTIIGGASRVRMSNGPLSRLIYFSSIVLMACLPATLVIDRLGDFSEPSVAPARVLDYAPGAFLAGPDATFVVTYPDGKTEEVVVGARGFGTKPKKGAPGHVVIGNGLLGIRYLKDASLDLTSN